MLNLFGKQSKKEEISSEMKISAGSKIGGRKLQGTVLSNKMKKTVVVAVSHAKKHPKYQKYFTLTKRLKAHDENNQYQVGDKVIIQETRPMSKEKRWVVVSKLK